MNARLAACPLIAVLLLLPAALRAQAGGFSVDTVLARRGLQVWGNSGCWMCHRIGTKGPSQGPDLAGLLERRTPEWVSRFLRHTATMQYSDSIARELAQQYRNQRMPQFNLSSVDVSALIHYIAQQDQALDSAAAAREAP